MNFAKLAGFQAIESDDCIRHDSLQSVPLKTQRHVVHEEKVHEHQAVTILIPSFLSLR